MNDRLNTLYEQAKRPEIMIGAAVLAVGVAAGWLAYRRNPRAVARLGRQMTKLGKRAFAAGDELVDEARGLDIDRLAAPLRRIRTRGLSGRAAGA